MARKTTIKLDHKGIGALLRSPEVLRMIERKGRAMKRSADAQVDVESNLRTYIGFDRARASLQLPMAVEAKTGALSRSLDAAKGA